MVVLLVILQMIRQTIDALSQNSNLDLRRTRVLLVLLVLIDHIFLRHLIVLLSSRLLGDLFLTRLFRR